MAYLLCSHSVGSQPSIKPTTLAHPLIHSPPNCPTTHHPASPLFFHNDTWIFIKSNQSTSVNHWPNPILHLRGLSAFRLHSSRGRAISVQWCRRGDLVCWGTTDEARLWSRISNQSYILPPQAKWALLYLANLFPNFLNFDAPVSHMIIRVWSFIQCIWYRWKQLYGLGTYIIQCI